MRGKREKRLTISLRCNETVLSSSVKDAEGVVNYATIIIRNDNSKLKEVIEEFTNTIMMFSVKPE